MLIVIFISENYKDQRRAGKISDLTLKELSGNAKTFNAALDDLCKSGPFYLNSL